MNIVNLSEKLIVLFIFCFTLNYFACGVARASESQEDKPSKSSVFRNSSATDKLDFLARKFPGLVAKSKQVPPKENVELLESIIRGSFNAVLESNVYCPSNFIKVAGDSSGDIKTLQHTIELISQYIQDKETKTINAAKKSLEEKHGKLTLTSLYGSL